MVFHSVTVLLVLGVGLVRVARVASYSLEITPEHVLSRSDPTTFTVTCKADFVIKNCQFTYLVLGTEAGPRLELSQGSRTSPNSSVFGGELLNYTYSGQGLEAGECGVTLTKKGFNPWLIGCRTRSTGEGWVYAWMDLYFNTWNRLSFNVTPKEVVALPGGEAKFLVKSSLVLHQCRIYLPGDTDNLDFDQGSQSNHSTGRHHYQGAGLRSGECGLALANVTEADNKLARFYICNQGELQEDSAFVPVIVASPPSRPVLEIAYEGDHLTARCSVRETRPRANMTWLIGEEIIRDDSLDDSHADLGDEWKWPWTRASMMQKITRTVRSMDRGRRLKCVVTHVALVEPLVTSETIVARRRA